MLVLAENTIKKHMFKLKYFFFFFYLISVNILSGQEVTSYYLIRHAEKVLTNPNNPNPHLTTKGHKRSLEWKKILEKFISTGLLNILLPNFRDGKTNSR